MNTYHSNFIKLLMLSTCFFVLATSCDRTELLEKNPISTISNETAFETEGSVLSALNAAYDPLQWQFNNNAHTFPQMLQSIRADDHHSQQASFWAAGLLFDDFPLLPNNQNIAAFWGKWYKMIARANFAIMTAEGFEFETPDLQQRIIAEAKFLRGFAYFELVKHYGGVPLITAAITSTSNNVNLPRASESEVYAQIESDLADAASVLPVKGQTEAWRATSGAANALLAKVHLYLGEYSETVRYTEAVINSGIYSLEENFADNFDLNNEFGKESIFEINYVDGLVGNGFETNEQQEGSGSWQFMFMWAAGKWLAWGNMIPRQSLIAIYDDNDQRKAATFLQPGDVVNSPGLAAIGWDPIKNPGFAVGSQAMNKKFFITYEQLDELLNVQQSPLNEKVLRYADVLLMHAEASLMGGGGNGQASFEEVTMRAYNSTVPYTLENIKLERRKELATEGWNRFTDLKRWGDLANALQAVGKNFVAGRDELLPIPQSEINLVGSDILQQNPGY
ncbi:MAG: RagB/SusD family nutrient uptake outer membrane protein [Bacteroidota bacterium]